MAVKKENMISWRQALPKEMNTIQGWWKKQSGKNTKPRRASQMTKQQTARGIIESRTRIIRISKLENETLDQFKQKEKELLVENEEMHEFRTQMNIVIDKIKKDKLT